MKNVAVIDQPRWPALDARATSARMSFRLVWKATDEKILYENAAKHFRVEGFRAIAQLEARIDVPSLRFSWTSDPLAASRADFAMIGEEVNGRYYDHACAVSRLPSERRSITALTATMMDEADIRRAENSGRSDQPNQ